MSYSSSPSTTTTYFGLSVTDEPSVAIARIEAHLAAIKNQIDYSERSSAQLVRMVDERFSARFDSLEKRLDEMDAARQRARNEESKLRDEFESRLSAVEKFNTRLVGIAVGVSLATGGATAAMLRALGET